MLRYAVVVVLALLWVGPHAFAQKPTSKPTTFPELGFSCVIPRGYKDVRGAVEAGLKKKPAKRKMPGRYFVRSFAPKQYAAISLLLASKSATALRPGIPADQSITRGKIGAVVKDKRRITLFGVPALLDVVEYPGRGGMIVRRQVTFVRHKRAYVFTFFASKNRYTTNVGDFDRCLQSVVWLPSAP